MSRNILLLTADSLRADHLSWHGYERDTAPFLRKLARKSTRYLNAFSTSCHTREAMPALLTGQYPPRPVDRLYRLRSESVAAALSTAGYDTAAATAAPFLTEATNYDRGFDRFVSAYALSGSLVGVLGEYALEITANEHYAPGRTINEWLLSRIDNADASFFAWGHYMDVHGPYNRASERIFGEDVGRRRVQLLFRRAKYVPRTIDDDERRVLIDAYDDGIREFDAVVAELFAELEARDLLGETTVVITADHGEAFGENDFYEHRRFLEDELLHVPLLVYDPTDEDREVMRDVSTIDVAPTLCDLAGASPRDVDGVSLFDEADRSIRATCTRLARRKERIL